MATMWRNMIKAWNGSGNVAVIVSMWVALIVLAPGCKRGHALHASKERHAELKQAHVDVSTAAATVGEATNTIEQANNNIVATVPQARPSTDQIAVGVEQLKGATKTLETASGQIESGLQQAAALSLDLDVANRRIKELEQDQDTLLSRLLAATAFLGLMVAIVSAVWLRSWDGALLGLSVFAGCLIGQVVLQYRLLIALCAGVAVVVYVAWRVIVERKASSQIVQTVEAIKGQVPDFKTIANAIQTSPQTRRIVDRIKGAVKKHSPTPIVTNGGVP
jgi:hypothetical protein